MITDYLNNKRFYVIKVKTEKNKPLLKEFIYQYKKGEFVKKELL